MIEAIIYEKSLSLTKPILKCAIPKIPRINDEFLQKYKVIMIGYPIPIGTDLSSNDPQCGVKIYIETLPPSTN